MYTMFWPILLCLIGLVLLIWARWRYKNRRLLQMSKNIRGPPSLPLLGNALCFIWNPAEMINIIDDYRQQYGDLLKIWLGPDLNIILSNPDDIKVVLSSNSASHKGPLYKYMEDVIGDGILSGSGPVWRKHRKLATPNYSKRSVEGYNSIFNEEVNLLLDRLQNTKLDVQFNCYKPIVDCTTQIVCTTMMGLSKEQTKRLPHLQDIVDLTPNLYDIIFLRMTTWYLQIDPVFWLTQYHKSILKFAKQTTEFGKAITEHRLKYLKEIEDHLKHMQQSTDEDDISNKQLSVADRFILSQEMNDTEIIQEIFTLFTASQEATAKIASATILMMAYHPECQNKLYTDIKTVFGNENRIITEEDLKQMPYLDMVFKEIIRMFPIGALLQRQLNDDIRLDSRILPAGSCIVIPVYHIQRDPRYWKNPNAFEPERFSPENWKNQNAYIPFSLGPMDCLGRHFGIFVVKTIVIRLLQKYEVSSDDKYEDMKVSINISAFPRNGYNVRFTPRK